MRLRLQPSATLRIRCALKRLFPALLLITATAIAAPKDHRPNVILILADDMAVGDLSCRNGGRSRTPNLDRLWREGVNFPRACSGSAVCAPARAALLTGRYPHRTGAVTLNMEKYPELSRIRKDETTMADLFRAGGYRTGLIGKWHSGAGPEYHPLSRGFDEFEGFIGHLYVPNYFNFKLDIQRAKTAFPGRYLTEDLSARALNFVRRHRDERFFLHLAHYAPHRPLGAPEERIQPYVERGLDRETATVYAMIEIMDEGIGALLAELERLKLRDNTIVIFASDNGPDPLVAERFNLDQRGTKYTIYQGGIHVPFVFQWPARYAAGTRAEVVHFTDVLPTLVELCGLDAGGLKFDGASLAPILAAKKGALPKRRFWQWNRLTPRYTHNAAVREGDWKLVRPYVTRNIPKADSTLPPALYNLADDPAESRDVSGENRELTERLAAALERWSVEVERDRRRPEATAGR